jgi:PAS domain S-box-containing protein
MKGASRFIRRILEGELAAHTMELRFRRCGGELLWAHVTITLVHDPKTEAPLYFVVMIQDVTVRKAMEARLSSASSLRRGASTEA